MEQPILQVEHLTKFFSVGPHAEVHAVDDVNFTLRRGRTFGLVGESGCGKSSCARTIIRIYEPSQGKIIFNGQDIAHLKPRQMQPVRRNMQMIFQDPYASLNARMTVRDIIAEQLKAPVIPVALNTGLFWAKNSFLRYPGKVIIEFMEPMPEIADKKEFMAELEKRIEGKCAELNAETLKNYPYTKVNLG